jgi:3-deoxy-D-manno-octulosonic-acid transferase
MIRFIYNLLWPIGLLFFLPGYLVKMFRRGGYRQKFGQRLGIYDADVRMRLSERRFTWFHAVSVGEVAIALKLAHALRVLEPDLQIALTTTTTTGFAFASKNASSWIEVMYSPLDFWPVMRRAFSVINPARIVLAEAEVWPNLVSFAHARRIPIALVNARLSPRSEKRFRRFRFFVAPIFRLLDLVCVQEPEDVDRWATLGIDQARIKQLGSIKFDSENAVVDPTTPRAFLAGSGLENRVVIFGGSTHAGEEKILAEVFRALCREFVDLLLLIAPRHVERTSEVRRTLEEKGFRVALRSQPPTAGQAIDCLLLDSMGELQNWYGIATVVFVGKSLVARGGQNPAEAILAGKPVLFGPHMENFAPLVESLLVRGGAVQIKSATELRRAMSALLADPERREMMVRNARSVLEKHHGATARTARLIVDLHSRG